MYNKYFEYYFEIKPEFNKEFISLWPGWLGKENSYQLDEVTELEWAKFNSLIRLISKRYQLYLAKWETEDLIKIDVIESTLSNYKDSMNKPSSEFLRYVIPELDCVLTEEWDYTYILWHKNKKVVDELQPSINKAGLYNFDK